MVTGPGSPSVRARGRISEARNNHYAPPSAGPCAQGHVSSSAGHGSNLPDHHDDSDHDSMITVPVTLSQALVTVAQGRPGARGPYGAAPSGTRADSRRTGTVTQCQSVTTRPCGTTRS
jgi:hypothetical protein